MSEAHSSFDLRRSVVKIFTVIKEPNYYQPWDLGYQKNSGGSGCILEGQRILTNAHIVSNQVYIQVLKPGDPQKYTARLEYVDHDSETALIRVEDETFFKDTVPVELGDLPKWRDKVAAYGFPIGGNELSITEGVVSRIEVQSYKHSQRSLLAVQIDAAINPGNSGGPVFKDGKLIGIAFQSFSGSKNVENTGYVVPIPVIQHFLKDIENGDCEGVPGIGIYWQRLEGEGLRDFLQLTPEETGVLATRVVCGSSAWEVLEEQDVITAIAGAPIANDGSVHFRTDGRVNFSHIVSQHQVGETVDVELVRKGEKLKLPITLRKTARLVTGPEYDVRPTYLIYAGVVFTPLTYNYMHVWNWKDVDPRFRFYYVDVLPSLERRQVVIVNQVLAHDINVGYHNLRNAVVDRINGQPITHIKDVLEAVKSPLGKYHVIELDHHAGRGKSSDYTSSFGTRVVLAAAEADTATEDVLNRYGIASDRSKDL